MEQKIMKLESRGNHEFTEEQVKLIKTTIAAQATDPELSLFLYTAKRLGLDPLAKQIHFSIRINQTTGERNPTFITSIDGYRLIADRSGNYAGSDDPIFDNEEAPTKATVTVYKFVNDQRCAFSASARWSQYFPEERQGFMWKKMPHLMLGKCAEALALRKAFPAELSGVYSEEEMQQSDFSKQPEENTGGEIGGKLDKPKVTNDPPVKPPVKSPEKKPSREKPGFVTELQITRLYTIASNARWSREDVKSYLLDLGYESSYDIKPGKDYNEICAFFENNPRS